MEEDKIEIRSNEVQEVLEQSPVWIIRWGITLFFAIVALLLSGSWFFKYPQILVAPVVITTENPPASVVARTSGKISVLFIADKQNVAAGQFLAYIENPADFYHFSETRSVLDNMQKFFVNYDTVYFTTNNKTDYTVGELQSGYSGFIKQFEEYKDFVRLNFHRRKIWSYEQQIENYQTYKKGLSEQYNITRDEHYINRRQFSRDSLLFEQNLIPEADYEKSEKSFLQSNFVLKNADNFIISTQIRINELKQNILDLEIDYAQQRHRFENELKSQYDNLLSQFKQYEYNYVLKSPVQGKVAFTKYWSTNQNVTAGELVFTIVPSDPKNLIGKVNLPIQRSGEVKAGLNVIIKLDNYPYKEYGAIKGKVKSISLVPSENTYIAEISLNNGLTTNYGKKLDFTQEMKGTAEVVTRDMRLIERMIQPVRYILKRNLY